MTPSFRSLRAAMPVTSSRVATQPSGRVRFTAASVLLVILMFAGWSAGVAQQLPQVLHNHVRSAVSTGQAAPLGSLPSAQQMNLTIVLPLRNQAELTALLSRLYDPSSPDFHRFLTVEQFTEQFGPTAEDYQNVLSFAKTNGFTVTGAPANRLIVPINGTVAQINQAFNVKMGLYQHPTENRTFYSPDREPSLNLSVPIAHIAGLNNFSIPRPLVIKPQAGQVPATVTGSGPGGSYLGSDMRAAYYGGTTLTGNGQAVGLLEFGGYNQSDVDLTFSNAGQTYGVPINNVLLDGATGAPVGLDAEQVLDIVQAIGMAPGLSQVRVYIGAGIDDANIFNSMATENICKQLSSSWSWRPDDPSTDDVFFQEFAAQGQSLFVASGDEGAFDSAISPFFYPAEDDYVTSVGGTHLTTNGAAGAWASETVWNSNNYGSGGGISPDSIQIPSWQQGVATVANGGSTTLRNVPDVAMEGDFDNYNCDQYGCGSGWAGTSFAAPRWAGFMALINQQAVEAGTTQLGGIGSINSAIYSIGAGTNYASDFHDITSGNNDTDSQPVWFSATTGYDLTTGWGSANGQSLIDALAGPQVPGFWIAPTAGTLGVNQGASATTTITVTDAGGFTGSVTLAVTSTLPSGVTASWGTNPTAGTSVLTLTASSSATPGTTTVTVSGTSGTLTETTSFALSVHGPSFSLSASPGGLSVNQGSYGTSTISVTDLYGFTGNVNLSVSGLPSGVTAGWGTNPTSGNSVLTLTASSTAPGGTSNLTITGTSGALTETTNLALTVAVPTFTLSTQQSVSVGQGSSTTSWVYVNSLNGFTGNVTLSLSGLPSGVTAVWGMNPTTGDSSLTLTASSTAPIGQQTVTVTGTSGSLTETTTFVLGVYVPTFTLSDWGSVNLGRGSSSMTYVYVNPEYGFTGNVTLGVTGLPSGVTAMWNPNPTSGYSALTLTASNSAPIGQYTLTITGTSGSVSATTTLSLGVFVPTFTLSAGGLNIGQGSSGTSWVNVFPQYGFTGSVNLAASGLPSGVTASFSPNPTNGSSTLTLTASSTATTGQYTVTITGTSGSQTATTTFTLGVYVPTFTLGAGGTTIGQGTSGTSWVNVWPQYGFTGSVNLTASGLPTGVTASFSPNPATGSSTMTLTASSTATTGQYTVTITGTSGSQTATTTFSLGVYVPTFTLWGPGSLNIGQGTSGTSWVSVNPQYGFTGSVTLTTSTLPSGVTASFSPNPATGYSTMTLTASSTAATGQYNITITGTSGTQTATTTLSLGVYAPTFTLSASDLSMGQGTTATSYVWLNPQYGFNGSVNLAVSGLPSGVTASFSPNPATGNSMLTLTATGTAATGQYTVTVTGTSGSQSASTTFGLGVYPQGFTLSDSGSISMNEGTSSAPSYVYLNPQYGFSGSVTLSASGLPGGVTASFSPNPISSGSSTLTLTASGTATPGTVTVTITGTSGSLTATTPLVLTVNAPSFSLSAAPSELNPARGSSDNSTVVVIPAYGFAGNVTMGVSGLPSGVTAAWSPNPTTGDSVLTLTASNSASIGTTTATVTGTSGALTATLPLYVTVKAAAAATSTTLAVTSAGAPVTSVASGAMVTLTAAVDAGSTKLTTGQVRFCDAAATYCEDSHLLGTAQLTSAGTAVLKFVPSMGSHSYKAVFLGTNGEEASFSNTSDLTVTAATTTTIAQSGDPADGYTLTATVQGQGLLAPTGDVSFIDTTNGNTSLGSATLGQSKMTLNWQNPGSPATGNNPVSIAIGDFNGDGIPDLAVVNETPSTLTILLGNGDGTFTATAESPQTGSYPSTVAVGDFNGDGIADLAVANWGTNSLTILLGNGDGTFTASAMSPQTGSGPSSIAVGDFNGDGIPDLAVANASSNSVTILLGNGDGTFTPSAMSPQTGRNPESIRTADFNGDGIQDIAVSNYWDNTVSILLGNGDGTFAPASILSTGSYPSSIAVGDFNGDGKPDLAVANMYSDTLTILLGNGDGTFAPAAAVPTTGNLPTSITAGDFNGDGKDDLAVANRLGTAVTILLGNGDGTFAAGTSQSAGAYQASIAAADFIGTGTTGLAVANQNSNTVTVLTQQITQTVTATVNALSFVGPYGTNLVDASYAGDSNYQSSVSRTTGITPLHTAPTVTLSLSASSIETIQPLTVTVAVSGGSNAPTPTGSVTLTSGSYSSAATALGKGGATITIPAGSLPAGSNTLTVIYTPDAASAPTYVTASNTASVTVTALGTATPTVTVTLSASNITTSQPLTVTVAVSGVSGNPAPSGTVTLTSGSYSAQQPLSGGTAGFTIAAGTLSNGANGLTAAYSGDGNYAPASGTSSVTVSQVVITPPTPAPVSPGDSATGNVTLTAGSTYTGTMNLTCTLTNSPAGAQSVPTCSLNPASITFSSSGSGTTALTVSTTAASTASLVQPSRREFWRFGGSGSVLALVLLFGLPKRRRRWVSMLVLVCLIAAAGAIGCGGGGGGSTQTTTGKTIAATTAGSYTFTVTGTDTVNAKITTSASVGITVQ